MPAAADNLQKLGVLQILCQLGRGPHHNVRIDKIVDKSETARYARRGHLGRSRRTPTHIGVANDQHVIVGNMQQCRDFLQWFYALL